MPEDSTHQHDKADRDRFAQGLPGYHDPTAGIAGASPALSALTLRLVLAIFGALICSGGAIAVASTSAPAAFCLVLAALAVSALIDIAVIVGRKRRGEPG